MTAWLITALWGSLLLGASLIWPMGSGLDEKAHIDMAYEYYAHPFKFYGPGELKYSAALVQISHNVPDPSQGARLTGSAVPRDRRPTLAQLGGTTIVNNSTPNQMVQHPPLYYWSEAIVLALPGVAGLAWDVQVWLMRLLSVVFLLPVPLLCWGAAKRLLSAPFGRLPTRAASGRAFLAAAVPLTIPDLVRDGASVDNDALLILTTSVVLYGLARVVTGDVRVRTGLLISVATAAALWTKGFALALPLVILIAYLYVAVRSGPWRTAVTMIWRPVLVVAIGCLVGSLWWIRNLIDYQSLQPNGYGAYYALTRGAPDHAGSLAKFVPPFISDFLTTIWGEIGIPSPPSPGPIIVYGWFFVVLIGVISALLVTGRRGERTSMAVLLLVPLAYFGIMAKGSYSTFLTWSRYGPLGVQGRYIYGGIVAAGALFAVGCYKLLRPRFHARIPFLFVIGALITNAAVWLLILRSWYQAAGDQGYLKGTKDGLRALVRWSPVPDAITILLVFFLPVIAGIAALVGLGRNVRTRLPTLSPAEDFEARPRLESASSLLP